jgi:hypothetical protein
MLGLELVKIKSLRKISLYRGRYEFLKFEILQGNVCFKTYSNFNRVFPVVVLVFDLKEFSEEVLHGHLRITAPPTFVHEFFRFLSSVSVGTRI